MSLTVLNAAYPLARVAPGCVGGAEEIVRALDAGITARGHHSIVVAQQESSVRGTLLPIPRVEGFINDAMRQRASRMTSEAIAYALGQWEVDVIHLHSIDFAECVIGSDVPQIATLHLPIDWYSAVTLREAETHVQLVCVSQTQGRTAMASGLHPDVIENGAEVAVPCNGRRHSYVAALGRICPEKAFHEALDAARLADRDLRLAGCTFPIQPHREYFRREILPRLDTRRRFIGPVSAQEKAKLLANARCVLIPSRVHETSSLVAMESLAAGTPVIAFHSGALSSIVEHGRTGFLVHDARGMADAIAAVDVINPDDCRESAYRRFSVDRMVDEYVACYERAVQQRCRSIRCAS